MNMNKDYQLDNKTISIYRDLKFEPVFRSLDMSVQLHMILKLDNSLKNLKAMGQDEKFVLVTSEFVYNNISLRGTRRTRRVLEFCDAIDSEYTQVKFDDPEARKEMLKMFNR
jgi:hypothetical protein